MARPSTKMDHLFTETCVPISKTNKMIFLEEKTVIDTSGIQLG